MSRSSSKVNRLNPEALGVKGGVEAHCLRRLVVDDDGDDEFYLRSRD